MYYIDTPTQQVVSFDFDSKTGEISNRSVVYTFNRPTGGPFKTAIRSLSQRKDTSVV